MVPSTNPAPGLDGARFNMPARPARSPRRHQPGQLANLNGCHRRRARTRGDFAAVGPVTAAVTGPPRADQPPRAGPARRARASTATRPSIGGQRPGRRAGLADMRTRPPPAPARTRATRPGRRARPARSPRTGHQPGQLADLHDHQADTPARPLPRRRPAHTPGRPAPITAAGTRPASTAGSARRVRASTAAPAGTPTRPLPRRAQTRSGVRRVPIDDNPASSNHRGRPLAPCRAGAAHPPTDQTIRLSRTRCQNRPATREGGGAICVGARAVRVARPGSRVM